MIEERKRKRGKSPKQNRIAIIKRRYDLIEKIVAGWSRDELVDLLKKKYGISIYNVDYEIRLVYKEIKERKRIAADNIAAEHIIRYENLYKELENLNWHSIAMKALVQKEKLLKIDDKRQHTNMYNIHGNERNDYFEINEKTPSGEKMIEFENKLQIIKKLP